LFRLLALPLQLFAKLVIHSGCGFLCLWLLNTTSAFTGVYLPVNAVTVFIAGFLGLPGIGLIALLELAA
jgi:inhibitor of the pro-sigma K processing machinery